MSATTTDSVLSPRTRWTIVGLLSASITINLLDRQVLSVLASEQVSIVTVHGKTGPHCRPVVVHRPVRISGQRVLRNGQVAHIDDIADHFYDVRHVLAYDHHREAGEQIRRDIYRGYPGAFRANTRRAWSDLGVPCARYLHNAIGLSSSEVVVLQREGTVEEIGAELVAAGADDGLILDNGGSVACWAWWVNAYAGGLVSPTVDYRPPGTSVIAFALKGPSNIDLPGGSVSYSVA